MAIIKGKAKNGRLNLARRFAKPTDSIKVKILIAKNTKIKGIFTLKNLEYSTDTIESLVAKQGRFKGEILYLDGSVVLKEKEGYTYETEHANYNQETDILNITAPFVGIRDKNIIKGNTLRYDTRKKETFGTKIDSVLYTTEK